MIYRARSSGAPPRTGWEFPLATLNQMNPTNQQAQGLYRLCYRLTNVIYPQWQYRNIELVRIDERKRGSPHSQRSGMGKDSE